MIDLVAFGIIIDDLVFHDGRTQMGVLGGGGVQTAWGMAAALGSGETVGLVAGIGSDLDQALLDPLRAAKINLEGVRVTPSPTPRAWQIMEADGRRTQVWRTARIHLGEQLAKSWTVLPTSYQNAQNFHWGIHVSEGAPYFANWLKTQGRKVSLETFKGADQPLSPIARVDLFRACDIFSPTLPELETIIGYGDVFQVVREFGKTGGTCFLLRKGNNGATAFDVQNKMIYSIKAVTVNMMDEVGAGNAFCGAFLARLGDGIEAALCHAATVASYMLEQVGIPATLPDKNDYERRLEQAKSTLTKQVLPD